MAITKSDGNINTSWGQLHNIDCRIQHKRYLGVLASIEEALSNGITASRKTLEERSDRYWVLKEDWTHAFIGLVDKNLVSGNDDKYELTDIGRPMAMYYYAERPDLYWYFYQKFYALADSKNKRGPVILVSDAG